jgi:hypothetical protein
MVKEFTPDLNKLKAIHKDYLSWKKATNETLLRNNNSIGRVQVQAKTMGEAGGKEAIIARLLYAQHNTKHVEYYFDMNSKDKKALNEETEISGFDQFKNAVMESVLNEATEAFFANFKDTMKNPMQITSHTGGKANLRSKGAAESLSNMRWMLDDKDKVAVHKLGGGTQVENDFILKKINDARSKSKDEKSFVKNLNSSFNGNFFTAGQIF